MVGSLRFGTAEAEAVRAVQRQRSAALLKADIQAAQDIHADDFQLITPLGAVFSKEQYLGAVAAGVLKYTVMELDSRNPNSIRVRARAAASFFSGFN